MPNLSFKLSPDDVQDVVAAVTARMAEHAAPSLLPAALKAKEAARYLGISRSAFYLLLKLNPDLDGASIYLGGTRIWPRVFLDTFLLQKQGHRVQKTPSGSASIARLDASKAEDVVHEVCNNL